MIDADDVPWPIRFVPASQLVGDEATDLDVRHAVERVEDGGQP